MSRQKIPLSALRQRASTCHSWAEAAECHPQIGSLFPHHSPQFTSLERKLKLTGQALSMLCALNDFDRRKVTQELLDISRHPSRLEADTNRRNPLARLLRTKYPFSGYHYKIKYSIASDERVVIDDVYFDTKLLGANRSPQLERNALYRVRRTGNARFTSDFDQLGDNSAKVIAELQAAWGKSPEPTHRVETEYAAVNGMLNPLSKATWLMGNHLDSAYPKANMSEYTLFHNPTDGVVEDVTECGYDKRYMPARSHNVHHFAAVLHEAQSRGQRTHWVAHSQGAIIFSRAVTLAQRRYPGMLSCHSVALHGVGCNLGNIRQACLQAGVAIVSERNNPFDLVPNLGGWNRPVSGLAQSIKFMGLVFNGGELASPHTLPYLGLETYIKQLEFTGEYKRAAYARTFRPK